MRSEKEKGKEGSAIFAILFLLPHVFALRLSGNSKNIRRWRAAGLGVLLLMAVYCGGCAAAAATQLVPLAFQAATFAGVSVGSAVTGREPTEDEEDTAERCEALATTPPYMGELIHTEKWRGGGARSDPGRAGRQIEMVPVHHGHQRRFVAVYAAAFRRRRRP